MRKLQTSETQIGSKPTPVRRAAPLAETMAMRNERGNSRRTQHIEATGDEGRGGGNQTVEERIADLLSADEHGA